MQQPIGVFDSGIGGLSVWKEVQKQLPMENIIYFSDRKNCPYGNKTESEIIELSKKITEFLLQKNCKLIVVACNTATAAAIDTLRQLYSLPFVGMEPAIKPAALHTKTNCIGILATKGTFSGKLFKQTSAKFTEHIQTIVQQGDGLVELVEQDEVGSLKSNELLKKYLLPMVEKGVDKIVLGCTHYPFFTDEIRKIIPKNIDVINPAPAVAKQTSKLLEELHLLNKTNKSIYYDFFSSGDTTIMNKYIQKTQKKNYLARFKTYRITSF